MLKKCVALFGFAALLAGGARAAQTEQYITVKGSDTMVHLVSGWAESFMKTNKAVDVSVTGGGSGTGISALINGTADICASSRDIQAAEKQKLNNAQREFIVARDGIAVIVHPSNPLKELTIEQIRNIFTGAFRNWKEVGGPDQPFTLLSRESSSGTYVFFQEHVLDKRNYSPRARLMPATSAIIQEAASNKTAIGYVGLGYAAEAGSKVRMLAVRKDAGSGAVLPSEAAVQSGAYAIARPLYLYTKGEPQGLAKTFIDFTLSPAGQKIVLENGYVAVAPVTASAAQKPEGPRGKK